MYAVWFDLVLIKSLKFDPIWTVLTKAHWNTSNKIKFCAVIDFLDRFTV
jgi:hypothetical protein